jgi:predicted PurR-regulated permease PerM
MSEELHTASNRSLVNQTEMPLPSELSTVFLGGLFVLALLAAVYAAREIVLPVVLAFVLHLLLAPALRVLERLRAPRMLATVLLIGMLFSAIVAAGTALSAPARSWSAKLPEGVPRLEDYLSFLRAPIAAVRQFMQQAQGYVSGNPSTASAPQDLGMGNGVWMSLYTGTWAFAEACWRRF